jgi:hypothetical protein
MVKIQGRWHHTCLSSLQTCCCWSSLCNIVHTMSYCKCRYTTSCERLQLNDLNFVEKYLELLHYYIYLDKYYILNNISTLCVGGACVCACVHGFGWAGKEGERKRGLQICLTCTFLKYFHFQASLFCFVSVHTCHCGATCSSIALSSSIW